MRLLIFILALTCAFFVSASHAAEPDMNDLMSPSYEYIGSCMYLSKEISSGGNVGMCQELIEAIVEQARPGLVFGSTVEVHMQTDTGPFYRIVVAYKNHYSDTDTSRGVYGYFGTKETAPTCPPDGFPLYDIPVTLDNGDLMCAKPLDPYDNCPAPTEADQPTFGTGQLTTVCYNNPDGTQCKITSDETGFYMLPVSFGSSEPTRCRQRESAPIDETPEPEIKPAPEETDPEPEPDDLSAINKINENLDAINNNLIEASDSNDNRLDRLAEELQIGNQLLGEIRDNPQAVSIDMGEFASTDNGLLQQIADNTGEMVGLLGDEGDGEGDGEPAPDCIGDICDFDSDQYYADADKEMSDWLNKKEDLKPGQEIESYINKFNGFVGSAFGGFTGSCVAFNLDVSLRGQPKIITVGQHCSYYDQYFKPVLEWFLWVLTFVALLVISSQSFRAFSSI